MPYLLLCVGVLAALMQSGWATSKVMHGSMNSKCTSWNRTCIREAECFNQTCVCKGTKHGDGLLSCADEGM
ncbi:hypothetical protein V1264_013233 [Littorina saxatilis]|uniref:Uncharacterized protein n=1 Tax=Littorina saxatilis TaxID=31220 RepID=A0AAN9BQ50_9CAEN